ncbi:Cation-ATPase-N domain-containing protein [Aphelenchoides besseyi]|nr:Cation-ATPase-N domain-containing protein [Aphelenchoides besseyi]
MCTHLHRRTFHEMNRLMYLPEASARKYIDSEYGGIEGLYRKLRTDPVNGISNTPEELQQRREVFGANEIPPKPLDSFSTHVIKASYSVIRISLVLIAVMFLLVLFYVPFNNSWTAPTNELIENGDGIEGVPILVFYVVVVLVTAMNNYTKERELRELEDKTTYKPKFAVIRDGIEMQIDDNELVVGDVVLIKQGDTLSVDGIVIHSDDLMIEELDFTDKCELPKSCECDLTPNTLQHNPLILLNARVVESCGKILVTIVGIHSRYAQSMSLLQALVQVVEEKRRLEARKKWSFLQSLFAFFFYNEM